MKSETMAWGWKNPDGSIQEQTFSSADAAISCMMHRTSTTELEQIQQHGFRLCRVRLTIEEAAVLE